MNKRIAPSKALLNLANGLIEDDFDGEVEDCATDVDFHALLERAQVRARAIKFAMARQELQKAKSSPKRSAPLSARVLQQARSVLSRLAVAEPALKEKYSMAFRNGAALPDEEVVQILEDLQRLGADLDSLLDK